MLFAGLLFLVVCFGILGFVFLPLILGVLVFVIYWTIKIGLIVLLAYGLVTILKAIFK